MNNQNQEEEELREQISSLYNHLDEMYFKRIPTREELTEIAILYHLFLKFHPQIDLDGTYQLFIDIKNDELGYAWNYLKNMIGGRLTSN